MSAQIKLTKGYMAMVDNEIASEMARYSWHVSIKNGTPYAQANIKCEDGRFQKVLMHRKIMGAQKGQIIDHINGNTLDNRRSNLRIVTALENARNRRSSSRYGYLGVRKTGDSWVALISPNRTDIALGTYPTIEQAAAAYNAAANSIYGEFASPNKVGDLVSIDEIIQKKQDAISRLKAEINTLRGSK